MPPVTTRSEPPAPNGAPETGRRSRPERVAEEIKAWVVAENKSPGDRLPSEAKLIERFGMAKGTIREAMRILEAQGLVKSRPGPGGGVFVHEVSAARAQALLANYFYFKDLTIGDIYALRRLLEPEMAASLAGKLDAAQIGALEQNLGRYATPPRNAEEERLQHVASLDFHILLAGFGGNALLSFVIGFMASMLSDITTQRRLYEPRNYDLWRKGRDYQIDLIAALRKGDADRARAVMAEHMREAERQMTLQEARMAKRFLPGR